jgi:hypothetical protein
LVSCIVAVIGLWHVEYPPEKPWSVSDARKRLVRGVCFVLIGFISGAFFFSLSLQVLF